MSHAVGALPVQTSVTRQAKNTLPIDRLPLDYPDVDVTDDCITNIFLWLLCAQRSIVERSLAKTRKSRIAVALPSVSIFEKILGLVRQGITWAGARNSDATTDTPMPITMKNNRDVDFAGNTDGNFIGASRAHMMGTATPTRCPMQTL